MSGDEQTTPKPPSNLHRRSSSGLRSPSSSHHKRGALGVFRAHKKGVSVRESLGDRGSPLLGYSQHSQHTEISYYSDDDISETSFDDESDDGGDRDYSTRHRVLQRTSSRQSVQSTGSAYSLPLGAQDDVSSLGCETVGNEVDDISLKEEKRQSLVVEADTSVLATTVAITSPQNGGPTTPPPHPRVISNPLLEVLASPTANPVQGTQLQMGHPANQELDELLEEENEDEADERSNPSEERDSTKKLSDRPISRRRHRSIFTISPDDPGVCGVNDPSMTNLAGQSNTWKSLDESQWALELPKELDLAQARKYMAELAEQIPDSPTKAGMSQFPWNTMTPPTVHANITMRNAVATESSAKSNFSASEYTEVVIDDDAETPIPTGSRRRSNSAHARRSMLSRTRLETLGLSSPLYSSPPALTYSNHKYRQQERESLLSYDFTEVEEFEEEIVDEIEVVEEEDDDIVVEEEIIEETEVTEEEDDDIEDM